jgi:hypothetical protein
VHYSRVMYAIGDHVELDPTISAFESIGSIDSGSVGIVRAVDSDARGDAMQLVGFFGTDRGGPGESQWLEVDPLMPTLRPAPRRP